MLPAGQPPADRRPNSAARRGVVTGRQLSRPPPATPAKLTPATPGLSAETRTKPTGQRPDSGRNPGPTPLAVGRHRSWRPSAPCASRFALAAVALAAAGEAILAKVNPGGHAVSEPRKRIAETPPPARLARDRHRLSPLPLVASLPKEAAS